MRLDVRKCLGNFTLQARLSLPARGVTALFGVSGSGKTSLLRLIAGLDRPDEGVIHIGKRCLVDTTRGHCLPPHRRRIGVVFQEARLFPHYRVRGNLTYGMPASARSRFDPIVDLLGIGRLLDRMPGTLSGGEARRVSIGRALLSDPELLLMDEPLTGLDGARKHELLRYILTLTRDLEIPIVYISHDPKEISAIADHLVLIEAGGVVASDSLERVLSRIDLTTQLGGFDAASVLEALVTRHDDEYALTHLDLGNDQTLVVPLVDAPPGARCRIRIPVHDVALALSSPADTSYRNRLDAVIKRVGTLQDSPTSVELLLEVGHHPMRARLTRKSFDELGLAEGMPVKALIRCVAFDMRHL
ncbi:molybdenum ABC transporter ATP-binding protein [Billgrantia pellis]|uniref:Molybdenum ABC transporter ATP-binding protein n=1 Tax=Billgrantia pellis TaxID=2606936 RepID=A0A7V7G363_9GAMM|nr:molybdenum ABC transporter ATP-binding protein [Halomonas pellis]